MQYPRFKLDQKGRNENSPTVNITAGLCSDGADGLNVEKKDKCVETASLNADHKQVALDHRRLLEDLYDLLKLLPEQICR
jgi:hypothetical protein